jgi:dihydropteroate synthase
LAIPCALWGVLNVTPDSFSDGGRFLALEAALAHGRAMLAAGADVLDVGGESTRPRGVTYGAGFAAVTLEEELRRVVPVVERLAAEGAYVSVDTTKPEVARAALAAGARIVNDVSCGRDGALLRIAAEAGAELVLMHNRGSGEVSAETTTYGDLLAEVLAELDAATERAVRAGVSRERIWLDPGLGFAKTAQQSLALLARTDAFVATGQRVLIGASRKSFLAEAAPDADGTRPASTERLAATAMAVVHAARAGARAVRVHDVREMRQALLLSEALRR